jgi:transposase-like protein
MMKFVVELLGYKPRNVTRKKKSPVKKSSANMEKKFKRLVMDGYSINRARYLSRM